MKLIVAKKLKYLETREALRQREEAHLKEQKQRAVRRENEGTLTRINSIRNPRFE